MQRLFLVLFGFVCLCGYLSAGEGVKQGFIANPHQANAQIEFFTLMPEGEGPFPVMFLLHGWQSLENSLGGKQLVDQHVLERFSKEGIIAVAISIQGFGRSDGARDWCGADSGRTVAAVIEHFCHHPLIDVSRMGVYGISRGAILASMLHLYSPHIALQILESGIYDLTSRVLPEYLQGIKEKMPNEIPDLEEGLKSRSAIWHPASHAKTLILHGEYDDRRGLPSAQILHQQLIHEGTESILNIYPNATHWIPQEKWDKIISFVRQNFLNLYGIGIKVSPFSIPALQITHIYPGSSADEQGKLRVGDAILRISPHNDEVEIDTLQMPTSEFIRLVLGAKGTLLRLHVQHFDLTYEDVEIMRGSVLRCP